MMREESNHMVREHSSRSGERTLYPVAKIKNRRIEISGEKIKGKN